MRWSALHSPAAMRSQHSPAWAPASPSSSSPRPSCPISGRSRRSPPLALASGADRARDRAEALRERVAGVLTAGGVDAELALLDPLFERFDPAEVAAALLALQGEAASGTQDVAVAAPVEGARVKVFVGLGKKDRASAKDLVGALIREAGVAKEDIGRIEVRESFSIVDVAAGAADRAIRGLTGATIRGRRVLARRDRER